MFTTRVPCGFRGFLIGRSTLAVGVLTLSSCTSFSGTNPSITPAIFAPSPTASAVTTPTDTGTAAMTNTFAATSNSEILERIEIRGDAQIRYAAYYPDSFFTTGFSGDIFNRATGDGVIEPISDSRPIQVSVVGYRTASRPQIQFQLHASPHTVVFTAPQNTTSKTLNTSFVPHTTDLLRYSIIDTGAAAQGQIYKALITQ